MPDETGEVEGVERALAVIADAIERYRVVFETE